MPEITVSMAAGRTEEKIGMIRDITQALAKNLDADAVVIQINKRR